MTRIAVDKNANNAVKDRRLFMFCGSCARELDSTSSTTNEFKLFNVGPIPISALWLISAKRKQTTMLMAKDMIHSE